MSRAPIVTKAAEADILQGYRSYEEKQRGLGLRYLDEIEAAFDRVTSNPFHYQEVESDIRRAVAHMFPYLVLHTFDEEWVNVLAEIHGAQDPTDINVRLGA